MSEFLWPTIAKRRSRFPLGIFVLLALIVFSSLTGWFLYIQEPRSAPSALSISPLPVPGDIYWDFTAEVYDKIKENYWDKISDEQLGKIYKLALAKATEKPLVAELKNKADLENAIKSIVDRYPSEEKNNLLAKVNDLVLANLQPFGRSRLYTEKDDQKLRETVQNIDKNSDLYSVLAVDKNATAEQIKKNYDKKVGELAKDQSPEGQEKLAQINRAFAALSSQEKRTAYNQTRQEPTVVSRLLTPDIFYLKLTKFSPQSFDELQQEANQIDPRKKNGPTALIFDLRGNIGGAIDILPYFLGPFIGPSNYAYDFLHQGERTPFKTKVGWLASLVRYKKMVVLIDGQSQSSAEVMAATLKKYHAGVLVGTTTKGWGTIEKLTPLEHQLDPAEKYSILLVNSLTLREDGQPIEGKGVDPDIKVKDPDWPKQLLAYFNYTPLVSAVKTLIK